MNLYLLSGGFAQGLLYALIALSFSIVWQSAKAANFAIAGQSVVVAFVAYEYTMRNGPGGYFGSLIVALVVGGVLGAITFRLIIRRLPPDNLLVLLLATIGLNFVLIGLIQVPYARREPYLFSSPLETSMPRVGGLTSQHVLILVVTLTVLVALTLFLKRTLLGLEVRAVAEDIRKAQEIGIDVVKTRTVAWALGGATAGLAAVLFAPLLFLDTTTMNNALLVRALAAAIVGGLSSLPGAVLGGLVLGMFEAAVVPYFPQSSEAAVFALLTFAVIVRPEGLLGRTVVEKL